LEYLLPKLISEINLTFSTISKKSKDDKINIIEEFKEVLDIQDSEEVIRERVKLNILNEPELILLTCTGQDQSVTKFKYFHNIIF